MQVILLERIGKLGQMGDVVTVKDGFARNYLLPQKKAMRATKANMEVFENQRAQLEARNLELKSEAEKVGEKLDGQSAIIIRQAGDTGQLYGSVSTRDIAQALTELGFTVARTQVLLDRPIKALGLHEMQIRLHPEVEVKVTINVARTEEEAERQARGEDLTIVEEETLELETFSEDDDGEARGADDTASTSDNVSDGNDNSDGKEGGSEQAS
ncbi:MAG TPA: 50S ribosomal protein L9 [Rhizobiales bacterium]|nr:50S ribosomal protein L9 [Hyphomicrobiales bacterium]